MRCKPVQIGATAYAYGNRGSVAVEFALLAPVLALMACGIVDFGSLAAKSAALQAVTRIGAEYARGHSTDTTGIQNCMRNAASFTPTLSFPASFARSCECADGMPVACTQSCATLGRPGPNRTFVNISASQAFTPLVPWPGIPAILTAATEMRVQ